MTEKNHDKTQDLLSGGEGTLAFNFTQEDFKRFLTNLMGRPQTLEKHFFNCSFTISPQNIEAIDQIIDERIKQQNRGVLAAFYAKLYFSDDSSCTFSDLDSFVIHKEARNVYCIGIEVAWTYLIQFEDKASPEKQIIEVSANTKAIGPVFSSTGMTTLRLALGASLSLQIKHTARTWGVDMQSWLSGEIARWTKPYSTMPKWLGVNSEKVSIGAFIVIILGALIGIWIASESLLRRVSDQAKNSADAAVNGQLDFLIQRAISGDWPRFTIISLVFIAITAVIALIISSLIESRSLGAPASFLLFTDESDKRMKKYLARRKRSWFYYIGSLLLSIATSIVSSLLYARLFDRFV